MIALNNRTFDYLQKYGLSVMNKLVTLGEDVEMRKLGGIYVLGGLTMVNSHAAMAFPWLYQSFATNIQHMIRLFCDVLSINNYYLKTT